MKLKDNKEKFSCFFVRIEYDKSKNRNVFDVRASLKVVLQMEQDNFHLVRCLDWVLSLVAWIKL